MTVPTGLTAKAQGRMCLWCGNHSVNVCRIRYLRYLKVSLGTRPRHGRAVPVVLPWNPILPLLGRKTPRASIADSAGTGRSSAGCRLAARLGEVTSRVPPGEIFGDPEDGGVSIGSADHPPHRIVHPQIRPCGVSKYRTPTSRFRLLYIICVCVMRLLYPGTSGYRPLTTHIERLTRKGSRMPASLDRRSGR